MEMVTKTGNRSNTAKGFSVLWSCTFIGSSSSLFSLANLEASLQGEVIAAAAQVTVLKTQKNHCDSSQVFPLPEGLVFSGSLHSLKCQHPQIAWRWVWSHWNIMSIHICILNHMHRRTCPPRTRSHTGLVYSFLCTVAGFGSQEMMERKKESWEAYDGMEKKKKTRGLDGNRTGRMFHRCCSLVM